LSATRWELDRNVWQVTIGTAAGTGPSLQAVEQAGAPEAGAAGDRLEIAVLLELLLAHIVAEREAAVEAEGELVAEHALPEGPEAVSFQMARMSRSRTLPRTQGLTFFATPPT